jgi:hypothetical protein
VISFFQKFVSYFSPVILWQGAGSTHEHIEVSIRNGHLQLSVPDAIYSNDVNYPPFVEAWKHLHTHEVRGDQVVLVLGFGLGSVTAIADKKHNIRGIHFVGVDNEEVALDTARKYKQSIYRGPWELIDADVMAHLKASVERNSASKVVPKKAALAFIDLFNGAEMHPILLSDSFWQPLKHILADGAKVAINYMSTSTEHQQAFENRIAQHFQDIQKLPCGKNYCYIVEQAIYPIP